MAQLCLCSIRIHELPKFIVNIRIIRFVFSVPIPFRLFHFAWVKKSLLLLVLILFLIFVSGTI
jgi:hypothetical protein